jgi:hypothetical protein
VIDGPACDCAGFVQETSPPLPRASDLGKITGRGLLD